MTVLSLRRAASAGRQKPFDGTYTEHEIGDIGFHRLLGLELIARTRANGLLAISQEMFVLLANAGNDKAAVQAIGATYDLTLTVRGHSPSSLSISCAEFDVRKRQEEREFLFWLDSVYWNLALYKGKTIDGSLSHSHSVEPKLPETKKWVAHSVASLWGGKEDELGLLALAFLNDCIDSKQFEKRAPDTVAALKAAELEYKQYYRRDSYSFPSRFQYPAVEVTEVSNALMSAMPKTASAIATWIRYIAEHKLSQDVQRLFSYAYIDAGGKVLGEATET